ncbi:MAG: HAD family hydrolase [Legionellales bacterium]|nr:HAD family hydrolase [Legionellales bacterium]
MSLAIFDLDDTLIQGSSDFWWEQFLVERGVLNANDYNEAHAYFQQEYLAGRLDIFQRQAYFLNSLKGVEYSHLIAWRDEFMQEYLPRITLKKAHDLLNYHREQNHTLLIITAANRFITEPIAQHYHVEHLIAVDAVVNHQGFSGEIIGVPSFREGKVTRLQKWLTEYPHLTLTNSYFYSDSINDLPLLELVTHPVVVDPEEKLDLIAQLREWKKISLRGV